MLLADQCICEYSRFLTITSRKNLQIGLNPNRIQSLIGFAIKNFCYQCAVLLAGELKKFESPVESVQQIIASDFIPTPFCTTFGDQPYLLYEKTLLINIPPPLSHSNKLTRRHFS